MKFRLTLRRKIVFFFLIVVFVGGSVALTLGIVLYGKTVLERAQQQVKMDINSARMVYDQKIDNIQFLLQLTARRGVIVEELKQRNTRLLKQMLEEIRLDNNLDFLSLTDKKGIVLVRSRYPFKVGDDRSNDAMVSKALGGEQISGTQILSQKELNEEGDGLAERAFMIFVPIPQAIPRARDRETSGMVVEAAIPVIDKNDDLLGVIYGGILLNRN